MSKTVYDVTLFGNEYEVPKSGFKVRKLAVRGTDSVSVTELANEMDNVATYKWETVNVKPNEDGVIYTYGFNWFTDIEFPLSDLAKQVEPDKPVNGIYREGDIIGSQIIGLYFGGDEVTVNLYYKPDFELIPSTSIFVLPKVIDCIDTKKWFVKGQEGHITISKVYPENFNCSVSVGLFGSRDRVKEICRELCGYHLASNYAAMQELESCGFYSTVETYETCWTTEVSVSVPARCCDIAKFMEWVQNELVSLADDIMTALTWEAPIPIPPAPDDVHVGKE